MGSGILLGFDEPVGRRRERPAGRRVTETVERRKVCGEDQTPGVDGGPVPIGPRSSRDGTDIPPIPGVPDSGDRDRGLLTKIGNTGGGVL